jgi:RNA polymerase sigma-70 factor, ECF subfamily
MRTDGAAGSMLAMSCVEAVPTTSEIPEGRLLDPNSLGSHVDRLYRAAYLFCGSRQEAEDLVQDTFEKVLRRPRFLRRDEDLAYLLRVLRNTWVSSIRAKRDVVVTPLGDVVDLIEAPHDPIDRKLQSDALLEALNELSPPLREAVIAVDVVGLSYREAAQALGTKDGTIMSRLHRGRARIAARIAPVLAE